jgi:HEAT repeat protein
MIEQLSEFHIDFIKQVGLGINISRTYPKGHPSMVPVIQRLKVLLKEVPIDKESISLILIENVIQIEEMRYSAKRVPIVNSLVDRFKRLGIKSVTFNVDATDNDIQEFFAAMAATSADIDDYGNIDTMVRSRGITGVVINKFEVGVISKDQEGGVTINWENFLDALSTGQSPMTDEERTKELSNFLAGIGIAGNEPADIQSEKIIQGLEKLAFMIADQYGEDRWGEYSLIFARMLAILSPSIKKNIVKYRVENKKLATLFKELVPTMDDQDIIDIIASKAKEKGPATEEEVVDILKNVTGARLPDILSGLRTNVPQLDFEKIAARLMSEWKSVAPTKDVDKLSTKGLEAEMRRVFPKLRDPSHEERIKAVNELMGFSDHLFEKKNYDLVRLLVDRFDTMADAETDLKTFTNIVEAMKTIYLKAERQKLDDLVQFTSRKFGKHLGRKETGFLEKKNLIIKTINEIRDKNYVGELISLLWEPGTFVEAREALIALSDDSTSVLLETLKETDDRAVRMKIIDILVRIGEIAIVEVKKLLSSPEWFVRRNGAFILGEMKALTAIDEVGNLIGDNEERVQLEAVQALIKIGDPQIKDYIRKALNSRYRSVMIEAMKFLGRDDIKGKLGELMKWLKARKAIPETSEQNSRAGIIEILGKNGDDSVIPSLIEVLNEGSFFKGDLLHITKEAAINALGQIGTSKAIQALRDATNFRDQFIASKAREVLKRVEAKKV